MTLSIYLGRRYWRRITQLAATTGQPLQYRAGESHETVYIYSLGRRYWRRLTLLAATTTVPRQCRRTWSWVPPSSPASIWSLFSSTGRISSRIRCSPITWWRCTPLPLQVGGGEGWRGWDIEDGKGDRDGGRVGEGCGMWRGLIGRDETGTGQRRGRVWRHRWDRDMDGTETRTGMEAKTGQRHGRDRDTDGTATWTGQRHGRDRDMDGTETRTGQRHGRDRDTDGTATWTGTGNRSGDENGDGTGRGGGGEVVVIGEGGIVGDLFLLV